MVVFQCQFIHHWCISSIYLISINTRASPPNEWPSGLEYMDPVQPDISQWERFWRRGLNPIILRSGRKNPPPDRFYCPWQNRIGSFQCRKSIFVYRVISFGNGIAWHAVYGIPWMFFGIHSRSWSLWSQGCNRTRLSTTDLWTATTFVTSRKSRRQSNFKSEQDDWVISRCIHFNTKRHCHILVLLLLLQLLLLLLLVLLGTR